MNYICHPELKRRVDRDLGLSEGRKAFYRKMEMSKCLVNKCFLGSQKQCDTEQTLLKQALLCPPCPPYLVHIIMYLSVVVAFFPGVCPPSKFF